MLHDSWNIITGLKKYLDVVKRFDEMKLKEQKTFLKSFKRDVNLLIEFLELNLNDCKGGKCTV